MLEEQDDDILLVHGCDFYRACSEEQATSMRVAAAPVSKGQDSRLQRSPDVDRINGTAESAINAKKSQPQGYPAHSRPAAFSQLKSSLLNVFKRSEG
jgi:hypothetical protein